MFQLTKDEFEILKSQIVTSRWGGVRKLPLAFTEQGIAMLSGMLVLRGSCTKCGGDVARVIENE